MPLFALVVTETTTHVVHYEADDADQALRMAKGDLPGLSGCLDRATTVADVDVTVALPTDGWEHQLVKEPSTFGYPGEAAATQWWAPRRQPAAGAAA